MKEKSKRKLEWRKTTHLGVNRLIKPMTGNLLLLIEEERKRTLKQIEDAKKLLEKLKR